MPVRAFSWRPGALRIRLPAAGPTREILCIGVSTAQVSVSASIFALDGHLQVIRALDPKLNPATAEIQALKNQLLEKDRRILSLEVRSKPGQLEERCVRLSCVLKMMMMDDVDNIFDNDDL